MYWTKDETEIDGCIARLRADQRAYAQISEDAAAVIESCQRHIGEDAEEIAILQAERRISPPQVNSSADARWRL